MFSIYKLGAHIENGFWVRRGKKGLTVCGVTDDFNSVSLIPPGDAVKILPYAFKECGLATFAVIMGRSVRKIGRGAFFGCTNLKTLLLRKGVKVDPTVFMNCPKLEKLQFFGNERSAIALPANDPRAAYVISVLTLIEAGADYSEIERMFRHIPNAELLVYLYNFIAKYAEDFGSENARAYLEKKSDTDLTAAFLSNSPEKVDRHLQTLQKIKDMSKNKNSEKNAAMINDFIDISVKNGWQEMYLTLINYKNDTGGYKSAETDRFEL